MQVIEWGAFLEKGLPGGYAFSAITVGVFDGVHRGHQVLIDRVVHYSEQALPVIITFRQNLMKGASGRKSAYPGDISSFEQKINLFAQMGAAITVAADLTESFRSMSGTQFLQILQGQGRMGFLAVGTNFRCGYRQDTDAAKLQEINSAGNIPTEIIRVLNEEGAPISSSRTRKAICRGDLAEAQAMLGRPYILDTRGMDYRSGKSAAGVVFLDIQCPGRVLPPSGSYQVLLHGKDVTSRQASIQMENDHIVIEDTAAPEFIEFLT
ncbi:MAG: FAD synthetase family protein [Treponema sp.]|nr:FAD synthetase family protein [Treponema sp.]